MTRILLISGSTLEGSLQTAALRTAARFAPGDISATLYGGLRRLPAYAPGEPAMPEAVAELRQQVFAAHALLFCTPEYSGSVPGSLKNLLDWLVDGNALDGKPVAWLSLCGPGEDAGALATLETVLSLARARTLSSACVRIPLDAAAVGEHGVVTDPKLHLALLDMLHTLARSLATPVPRELPSWQAYSSLYPVVPRRETGSVWDWRKQRRT